MSGNFDTADFIYRAAIDFGSVLILVGAIYYPKHKNKDFVFTFVLFNLLNFLICYLLGSSTIEVGFAFGLFAIFSIIRYRTIVISIKDMGYFFVCVALGMMSALANIQDNLLFLAGSNGFVLLVTYLLDSLYFINTENSKEIIYDNVELIKPANQEVFLADLKDKTGLEIHRVEVTSINYLKDTALVRVYYYSAVNENPVPTEIKND